MLFLAQHRGYDAAKSSVVLYLTQIFAIRAQTDFPQMMFHRLQEGGSVRPSLCLRAARCCSKVAAPTV